MAFTGHPHDRGQPAAAARAAAPEPTLTPPTDEIADIVGSGDPRIDGLLFFQKWAGPSITYSDPDQSADYGPDYWADDDLDGVPASQEHFVRFSGLQMQAVHATLNSRIYTQPEGHEGFSVEGFTGLDIGYAGAGSGKGILRFGNSADPSPPNDTAYAFFPDPWDSGGDAWFDHAGVKPVAGSYDYLAIVHETGHTLGLKHGHEDVLLGALPQAYDALEYSVMTYRSYVGAVPDSYTAGPHDFPQTFMMLDIAALQHLYGADFTTRADDTTYSWDPATGRTFVNGDLAIAPAGNRVFLTIWDGGGRDTYDLSKYTTDLKLNLGPGGYSTFARAQLADLGGGPNGGHAHGNVFNALKYHNDPRSLVENAVGGSGDDSIVGNGAANRLAGYRGEDRLLGRDGNDRLKGNGGADLLGGGSGDDVLTGGPGRDVLVGGPGSDRFDFNRVADSPRGKGVAGWDVLGAGEGAAAFEGAGAAAGDVVDLRGLDARAAPGAQDLVFGGRGHGHLRLVERDGDTLVCADTRGDRHADFVLRIEDGATLASDYADDDFLL